MGEWQHGGRLIARTLRAHGIDTVFTLTGGHISAIFDGCVAEGIRVVDVRHEQAAAHAADAYGRLTFRPGVAAVTAGPGVTDAVTGACNALYANSPMLLLGGRNPLGLEGMGALQDAPQVDLLRPVTKRSEVALQSERLPEFVTYALRDALSPRMGPVYLDLPMDVLMNGADSDTVTIPRSQLFTHGPGPDPEAVAEVAALIAGSSNPVIMSGSGTYWARAWGELRELAEVARLPVYVNGMSRGILPSTHPNLLALTRKQALRHADLVIALGVDFDFRLGYGRGDGYQDLVKVIHVDPQADKVGHNRDVHLGIVSDIRSFLTALLAHDGTIGRSEDPAHLQLRSGGRKARRRCARSSRDCGLLA